MHTAGKRHLHNLTVQKMQQEEAKCSIFVRNFPIDKTSEEDLKEAFQAFGIVKKVALRDKVFVCEMKMKLQFDVCACVLVYFVVYICHCGV